MMSKRMTPKAQKIIQTWMQETKNLCLAEKLCPAISKPALSIFPEKRSLDFKELSERSEGIARVLHSLGVKKGDRVCAELPKCPELFATVVGCAQLGAVYVPLHTALSAESALLRIDHCDPKVVISDAANRFKLDPASKQGRIMATLHPTKSQIMAGDVSLTNDKGLTVKPPKEMLKEDDLMSIVYSSGTTGQPKGVEVPVKALSAINTYMELGLGLEKSEDKFWCAAHPDRPLGLFYGVYGPLSKQLESVFSGPMFNPEEISEILEQRKVETLLASPQWFKNLKTSGILEEKIKMGKLKKDHLKFAVSSGEPLKPATSEWFGELFPKAGKIVDHYGRTETGMIVVQMKEEKDMIKKDMKTHRQMIGKELPGFSSKIVDPKSHKEVKKGEVGELAIVKSESPLFWFKGYHKKQRFDKDLMMTGDMVSMEDDDQIIFRSRKEDVIMSNNKIISPIEIELGMDRHPAVAEVAVIGVPDEQRGEKIKGLVVLKQGQNPSDFLAKEIAETCKKSVKKDFHMPHEIEFVHELPRTKTNKIQRFALRKREAELLRMSENEKRQAKLKVDHFKL